MKSYLTAILVGGLMTAFASAQGPAQIPVKAPPEPPGYARVIDPCCEPYQPCVNKICVTEPAKKKITKTWYNCKCEDFCLPKCPHISLHKKKDCDGCDIDCCVSCEKKVRTKNVLYKRVITTECDSFKCVVKEVPVCEPCPPMCCPPACDGPMAPDLRYGPAEPIKGMPAPAAPKAMPNGKRLGGI